MLKFILGGLSLSGIAALIANAVRSDVKSQVTTHVIDKAESVGSGNPIIVMAAVFIFSAIIYTIHKS